VYHSDLSRYIWLYCMTYVTEIPYACISKSARYVYHSDLSRYVWLYCMTYVTGLTETLLILLIFVENMQIRLILTTINLKILFETSELI